MCVSVVLALWSLLCKLPVYIIQHCTYGAIVLYGVLQHAKCVVMPRWRVTGVLRSAFLHSRPKDSAHNIGGCQHCEKIILCCRTPTATLSPNNNVHLSSKARNSWNCAEGDYEPRKVATSAGWPAESRCELPYSVVGTVPNRYRYVRAACDGSHRTKANAKISRTHLANQSFVGKKANWIRAIVLHLSTRKLPTFIRLKQNGSILFDIGFVFLLYVVHK